MIEEYISTPMSFTYGEGAELFRDLEEQRAGIATSPPKHPNNPVEMDSELGLEVVQNETILDKYDITLDPKNTFHASLQRFFDKTGYLTDKQLKCFN